MWTGAESEIEDEDEVRSQHLSALHTHLGVITLTHYCYSNVSLTHLLTLTNTDTRALAKERGTYFGRWRMEGSSRPILQGVEISEWPLRMHVQSI